MTQEEKLEMLRKLVRLKAQKKNKVEQEQFQAEEEQFEDAPFYEKMGAGIGTSILKTAVGAQKFAREKGFPISSEDWQKRDEESLNYRDRQAKGGWGTAGRITGDIAQLAVPGTGGLKAAGAAQKGGKLLQASGKKGGELLQALGKSAPLATDIASSAGLSALQGREGMDRGEAATEGAKEALTGAVLGRVLSKTLRGVTPVKEAENLLQAGVPLTPAQAGGPLPRAVATATQFTPVLARASAAARERAASKYGNYALNKAAPPGMKILGEGAEGMAELNTKMSKEYDDAWSGAKRLSNDDRLNFLKKSNEIAERFGDTPKVRNQVTRIQDEFKQLTADYTNENVRRFDRKVRDAVESLSDDKVVRDELKDLRRYFRDKSGGEVSEKIKTLDQAWPRVRSVVRAGKDEQMRRIGGGVEPQGLSRASGQEASDFDAAALMGPMDDIAQEGMATLGREIPGYLPNLRAGLAKMGWDMAPIAEGVRRVTMGQTKGQESALALARALREAGLSGSTIYSAQADEE